MPHLTSLLMCATIFGGLQLATSVFRSLYYGIQVSWISALLEVIVVCMAGTFGFLSACYMLGRDFRRRTIGFIAVVSYFVSYSVTNLLQSVSTSPWVFVGCLFAISIIVTIRIGPKWEESGS